MNIEVKNLSFSFGETPVLKDVNMKVKEKEFVGLIGPNGSGKSTLLKCIYRVHKDYQGEILLDGRELSEFKLKETARMMGVVSQFNDMNFDFSVLQMVLLGRSPYKKLFERDTKEDYELARQALRDVGLEEYEDRKLSQLSGGEKQRIVLARALAQNTETYILDEPTNHLDIKHQLHIMNVIKGLDVTCISAIHDLNIAAMYCDKIVALQGGKVAGIGTPKELLTEELIYDLYEVESKVTDTEDGINIRFIP